VAVQFHPEFKSKPLAPHPLFAGFVEAAYKRKNGDGSHIFTPAKAEVNK
jgi:CTP synthase